jgi:hypothetical protein
MLRHTRRRIDASLEELVLVLVCTTLLAFGAGAVATAVVATGAAALGA